MPGPGPTATIAPTAGPRFAHEQQGVTYKDGGQAPHVLTAISPPAGYESYTQRVITAEEAALDSVSYWTLTLDDTTDYLIVQPPEVGPIRRPVRLEGGRNIVWIGGHIQINHKGFFPSSNMSKGLHLSDSDTQPATDRTIHIEGLWMDGDDLAEGFNTACPTAAVQIGYWRCERSRVRSTDAAGHGNQSATGTQAYQGVVWHHADGIQTQGGHRGITLERCTVYSSLTGYRFQEDVTLVGEDNRMRHCNVVADSKYTSDEAPYTDSLTYTSGTLRQNFNSGIGGAVGLGSETVSHNTTTPIDGAGSITITRTGSDRMMGFRLSFGSPTDWSSGGAEALGCKIRLDAGGGSHPMGRLDITDNPDVGIASEEGWHHGQSRKLTVGGTTQIFCPFPQSLLQTIRKVRVVLLNDDTNTTHTFTVDSIEGATGRLTNTFYGSPVSYNGNWGIRHDSSFAGPLYMEDIWAFSLPGNKTQDGNNYTFRTWDDGVTPVTPTLQAEGATSAVTTGAPSVTIPTHQADDILLVSAVIWAPNTAENVAEIPTPSGWELLAHQPHQVGTLKIDGYHALFWKRATGAGETVTLTRGAGWDTGTDTNFGARAYVIRGCRTTDTPFTTIQEAGPYTTANQALPAFRINDYNHLAMVFASMTAVNNLLSAATGYTVGTQDTDAAGTDCNFQTARLADPGADVAAVASTTTAPTTGSYMFFGVAFKGTSQYVDDMPPANADFTDYLSPEPASEGDDGTGHYAQWTASNGSEVRNWDDTDYAKVYQGYPPEGDFAPRGVPGLNYASAGWEVATAVNLTAATETDTAQAVTFTKTIVKTLTPATETDVAQGLDTDHYVTPGVAAETDTAQALDTDKALTLTAAVETDTAQAVSFTQEAGGVTLTPAAETDAAQALNVDKTKTLVTATETDAAQSLRVPKLTAAAETDTAQALDKDKASTLASATETDSAQALSVTKTIFKSLTAATESDAAQAVDKDKSKSLTASSETDTAQAVTVTKTIFKSLTAAVEMDQAQELSISQAGSFDLVPAQTTDTAQPLSITHIHYRTVGIAAEVDTAQAVAFTKTIYKTLGIASEADVAQAIDRDKTVTVSTATETDGAQALTTFKSDTLGPASETDAAQALSITHVHFRSITTATEVDVAEALSYGINLPWTYTVDEDATYDNVDNWTYENEDTFSYSP
jgi:hypothetical protein